MDAGDIEGVGRVADGKEAPSVIGFGSSAARPQRLLEERLGSDRTLGWRWPRTFVQNNIHLAWLHERVICTRKLLAAQGEHVRNLVNVGAAIEVTPDAAHIPELDHKAVRRPVLEVQCPGVLHADFAVGVDAEVIGLIRRVRVGNEPWDDRCSHRSERRDGDVVPVYSDTESACGIGGITRTSVVANIRDVRRLATDAVTEANSQCRGHDDSYPVDAVEVASVTQAEDVAASA